MNKESRSLCSLQDFVRTVVIPPTSKRDDVRTQAGEKWTGFEHQACVDQLITEPHLPWQNTSEHAMRDLGVMIIRSMKGFNVPLNQCRWCVELCKDVHDVTIMRKLGWRTPKEVLKGDAPEVSMFKFYVWEDTCCLDPDAKQPKHSMLLGNFLGIAWNHGCSLCYFI